MRYYNDNIKALQGAIETIAAYQRTNGTRPMAAYDDEMEAIRCVLRSAQDIERRIVEARIDELTRLRKKEADSLIERPHDAYLKGEADATRCSIGWIDARISELRASLATDRAGDGEGT